jgi:lipid II:glycine glycyltransferase (peptidoglycan interpeptide bridge formation enzyme)
MLIRPISPEEKMRYNQVVHHPLQTWEWGEFRDETGVEVERLGFFQSGKIQHGLQVTFHPLPMPLDGYSVGYFPRGDMPDEEQLSALEQLAQKHNALFIKMEPNVSHPVDTPSAHRDIADFLLKNGAQPGRHLFTKYTFQLDLTPSEDQLFANLDSKTRYNVRLAYRKGVKIVEDSTAQGMDTYLQILKETTKRQQFYAHSPQYFQKMWQELGDSGMIKIFHAVYEDTILSSWVMLIFDGVLYYPYGASRDIHRNVMANNLMMWEMIRYGKNQGCHLFDMWGSLGPNPDKNHSWYGFHKFKRGYGGQLVEFVGTYDLVYNNLLYKLFRVGDNLRWKFLRFKKKIGL